MVWRPEAKRFVRGRGHRFGLPGADQGGAGSGQSVRVASIEVLVTSGQTFPLPAPTPTTCRIDRGIGQQWTVRGHIDRGFGY
jgi:hypothetical protein